MAWRISSTRDEEDYTRGRLIAPAEKHGTDSPRAIADAIFADLDAFRDGTPSRTINRYRDEADVKLMFHFSRTLFIARTSRLPRSPRVAERLLRLLRGSDSREFSGL